MSDTNADLHRELEELNARLRRLVEAVEATDGQAAHGRMAALVRRGLEQRHERRGPEVWIYQYDETDRLVVAFTVLYPDA